MVFTICVFIFQSSQNQLVVQRGKALGELQQTRLLYEEAREFRMHQGGTTAYSVEWGSDLYHIELGVKGGQLQNVSAKKRTTKVQVSLETSRFYTD